MKEEEFRGKELQVCWLGQRDYQDVWRLQETLAAKRLAGKIADTLLLLEHPPTITLGRGAKPAHIVRSAEQLAQEGVTIIESDRGGDVTYHGPGQLVGYPILNLREPPHIPDLHGYLRLLEETLIQTLRGFDISAERFPGYTGVWTGRHTNAPQKIAAIGIKASRWITQHGFALNIHPDLSHFDWIVPCGITEFGVTSLQEKLQRPIYVEELLEPVAENFHTVFRYEAGRKWVEIVSGDDLLTEDVHNV